LHGTSFDLKKEIGNWTYIRELELDPYKLFFEFESDDAVDFDMLDLYLWPWTHKMESEFFTTHQTLLVYDGFFDLYNVEGFESIYLNIKGFGNPEIDDLLSHFSQLLDKSVWKEVSD